MAVVFDEVLGDVQPDDSGSSDATDHDASGAQPAVDVDELRRALERARRRDARLAAD